MTWLLALLATLVSAGAQAGARRQAMNEARNRVGLGERAEAHPLRARLEYIRRTYPTIWDAFVRDMGVFLYGEYHSHYSVKGVDRDHGIDWWTDESRLAGLDPSIHGPFFLWYANELSRGIAWEEFPFEECGYNDSLSGVLDRVYDGEYNDPEQPDDEDDEREVDYDVAGEHVVDTDWIEMEVGDTLRDSEVYQAGVNGLANVDACVHMQILGGLQLPDQFIFTWTCDDGREQARITMTWSQGFHTDGDWYVHGIDSSKKAIRGHEQSQFRANVLYLRDLQQDAWLRNPNLPVLSNTLNALLIDAVLYLEAWGQVVARTPWIMSQAIDWYREQNPKPDLIKMHFRDLMKKVINHAYNTQLQAYIDHKSGTGEPLAILPGDVVLEKYPDGAQIIEIGSRKSLQQEGKAASHCIGSFAGDLETGRIRAFSYRTPGGRPACTIAIRTADGTSVDLEAPGNHSVRNKEVAGRVAYFLVKLRDATQADLAGLDTFQATRYLYDREIERLRFFEDLYSVDARLRMVLPVAGEEEDRENEENEEREK